MDNKKMSKMVIATFVAMLALVMCLAVVPNASAASTTEVVIAEAGTDNVVTVDQMTVNVSVAGGISVTQAKVLLGTDMNDMAIVGYINQSGAATLVGEVEILALEDGIYYIQVQIVDNATTTTPFVGEFIVDTDYYYMPGGITNGVDALNIIYFLGAFIVLFVIVLVLFKGRAMSKKAEKKVIISMLVAFIVAVLIWAYLGGWAESVYNTIMSYLGL